jgi:5'-phosphate synthase pdxT subunit
VAGSTGPRVAGEGETRESLEGLRVGVLALQGDFREHAAVLRELGAEVVLVRRPAELASVAGLVIPGGESTVMDKLSRTFGMAEPLRAAVDGGLPVYGTCAGLIMLADRVVDGSVGQRTIGGLDVAVRRNAFGNQNDSFETDLDVPVIGDPPVVDEVGPLATAVGVLDDGRVVAVEQGNLLGTSFHPEVTGELRFHARFLEKARAWSSR